MPSPSSTNTPRSTPAAESTYASVIEAWAQLADDAISAWAAAIKGIAGSNPAASANPSPISTMTESFLNCWTTKAGSTAPGAPSDQLYGAWTAVVGDVADAWLATLQSLAGCVRGQSSGGTGKVVSQPITGTPNLATVSVTAQEVDTAITLTAFVNGASQPLPGSIAVAPNPLPAGATSVTITATPAPGTTGWFGGSVIVDGAIPPVVLADNVQIYVSA
jgi:hypothetical protein